MKGEKCMTDKFPYEDIFHLPPHISSKYPQPTLMERAARFAPFATIADYGEMVMEEARITDDRICLDESCKLALSGRLNMINESLNTKPVVRITYFLPDGKKSGGAYVSCTGVVKKIDAYERLVSMEHGTKICIDDIYAIEGDMFDRLGLEW